MLVARFALLIPLQQLVTRHFSFLRIELVGWSDHSLRGLGLLELLATALEAMVNMFTELGDMGGEEEDG